LSAELKKICFGGAYGIRSCGDDAALVQMTRMLEQRIGRFDGVVISRHHGEDLYRGLGLRAIPGLEFETAAEAVGKWFRGFNPDDDRDPLRALRDEIADSDLLILGAGNAFIDITIDVLRGPVPLMTVLCALAKMSGTPVMWYGIAVGPLETRYGRDLTRLAAGLTDVVTVRDPGSAELLRELAPSVEAICLPDPVLGLKVPGREAAGSVAGWRDAHGRGGAVIPVSVRGVGGAQTSEPYLRAISETCDRLLASGSTTVLFVPQCSYSRGGATQDDRTVARDVVARMKAPEHAVVIEEALDVDACLACYLDSDVALCTRLHGSVFAGLAGAVPVAVDYNPKVRAFMDFAGLGELTAGLDALGPDGLIAKIELARARHGDWRRGIERAIANAQGEIGRYGDLAAELMGA
jgi:polysaccharide pyruvyl transferase WcaK-like protein